MPPGVLYSAAHQCRLQHGSLSLLCDDVDNVCNTLWCTVGTTCHSKMDGAVDGTSCGEGKWCFNGECVKAGYRPERVNGGWSAWSEWSSCSRTCGVGVLSAHRDCVNPVPKYGGKYCLGERRRYRTCNRVPCLSDHPTFRDTQCSNFNTLAYKGRFHKWVAVNNRDNACELHCRPLNEHFSEKMLDAVADGTRCHEGNSSRDMCINGVCKNVGCDFVIDSSAGEDRCGVCQGDGSTCKTVTKTFEESEGLGYVDIGLIPKGARNIRVEELAEAGNFLALRSDNPDKYFLNGGWTIQWNGDYKAAGTIFTYERTGHLENLTSLGPTNEPLWIQLLFQETNPGVRYEYTISQALSEDNNTAVSDFFWKTGAWTECSASCGIGIQRQTVHCVERTFGIVEEHFCNPLTRPDNKQTTCHKELCPPIWWTGEWQRCSSSCGLTGMTKRTVLCIQAVDVEERRALQHAECKHMSKPEFVSSCNTHIPCPADWISGSWSDCSLTCGSGIRCRNVSCSWNTGVVCDPQRKPAETASCHLQDCPVVDDHFGAEDWSGSGWNSKEVINEINSLPEVNLAPKQSNIRAQPRTHNDLYNIIDADFTHHNHIEKTNRPSEKNIKVDDFYYDYNFINFHEDLSYDFDSEDNARQAGDDEVSTPKEHGENLTTEENISGKTPTTTSASFTMKTNDLIENSVKTRSSKPTSDLDDLPDDDYFLPVPTSPSVPVFPRDLSTLPSLEVNKNESTRLEKHEVEAKIANADHIKEDDDVTGTLHQFTHTQPNEGESVTSAEQIEDADYFEYYYSRKSTVGPDIYGSQGAHTNTESPLGLPSGENGAARPITSRSFDLSMLRPTAFIPEDTDVDSAGPFRVISAQTISGNQDTSAVTSSVTATHTFPPTELESGPRPPTWPTLTTSRPESTVELQTPRQPAVIGGTEPTISTPQAPSSYDWPEVDDNDIFIHPMLRTTGDIHPSPQRQHPLSKTVSPTHTLTEMVNVPSLPSDPLTVWPVPGLSSLPSPASTQVTAAAHWVVGNWSSCSTSCGLGATWRSLACSTGKESECNPAKRPAPARRCYLRPCSAWNIGEWSKCSKNCGGGVTSREVQCYDMRDQRPLRPFHCRAISSRPHAHSPCNIQPCLEWYTSSWGQCSEVCSGGQQQRLVTCPEEGHCDKDLLPSNIQPCNSHPCVQWLTGSWGQCSALCGGGVQHRLIKCVDTKADTEQEVDHSQCGHQPRPHDTSKCNLHECESAPSGIACLRDRLSFHFCQTLQWLGRCRLPTVQAQCCKTCNQGSRGNGPTSHR